VDDVVPVASLLKDHGRLKKKEARRKRERKVPIHLLDNNEPLAPSDLEASFRVQTSAFNNPLPTRLSGLIFLCVSCAGQSRVDPGFLVLMCVCVLCGCAESG